MGVSEGVRACIGGLHSGPASQYPDGRKSADCHAFRWNRDDAGLQGPRRRTGTGGRGGGLLRVPARLGPHVMGPPLTHGSVPRGTSDFLPPGEKSLRNSSRCGEAECSVWVIESGDGAVGRALLLPGADFGSWHGLNVAAEHDRRPVVSELGRPGGRVGPIGRHVGPRVPRCAGRVEAGIRLMLELLSGLPTLFLAPSRVRSGARR